MESMIDRNRTWVRRGLMLAVAAVVGVGAPTGAVAAEEAGWTVLRLDAPRVETETVETFRRLLVDEIEATGALDGVYRPAATTASCASRACAVDHGRRAQVGEIVYGELRPLGRDLHLMLFVLSVDDGVVRHRTRTRVDRLEDLDRIAARFAVAVERGVSLEETRRVDNLTAEEVDRDDPRSEGRAGVRLRTGGVIPLGRSFGSGDPGVGFDLGFFYEGASWLVTPTLGFRFDGDGGYLQVPLDIGLAYLTGDGETTGLVGGGAGMRSLRARDDQGSEHEWGFGGYLRGGVLFLRTHNVNVGLTAEYDLTLVDMHGTAAQQALILSIELLLGT